MLTLCDSERKRNGLDGRFVSWPITFNYRTLTLHSESVGFILKTYTCTCFKISSDPRKKLRI